MAGAPRPGLRAAADPFGRRGLGVAGRRGERTTVMRPAAMMGPGTIGAFSGRAMDAGPPGRGDAREAGGRGPPRPVAMRKRPRRLSVGATARPWIKPAFALMGRPEEAGG